MFSKFSGGASRRRRGSILLLAVFFLIVLFSLSVAFFRLIPVEYHSANRSRQKIQANYAADSGARHAVAWLKSKFSTNAAYGLVTPSEVSDYNLAHCGSDGNDPEIDWSSTDTSVLSDAAHKVDKDWAFLSRIRLDNADFFNRIYTIEACAYYQGRPMQVTRMTVQNQTFAEYALFISEWNNDFIFTMQPNGIQGPVHTNGFLRLAAPDTGYWSAKKSDGSPQDPWVNGPLARITHAGSFLGTSTDPVNTLGITADGVQYANGNSYSTNLGLVPYTDSGSPIAERYNKIVSGGRDNIRQVSRVEMPKENGKLREDAWGGTLPANNTQWNNAAGSETLLVNTDTGKANDPNGKVAGGIFVRGTDPSDVLLDLTPEGHQKIRIRQGNTSVTGATTTTYYADVPQYHKPIHHPAWTEPTIRCVRTATRTVDVWESVRKTRSVTQANAAQCGTRQEFVPGENGISQPITVPNVCTYNETYYVSEKTGTREETYCAETGPGTPINHPARTEWVSTNASDPDAQLNGTRRQVVDEGYPGAEAVTTTGTRSIQKWSSVVEVNDTDYKIPYYAGVKVNGVAASGPTDPILTVPDGHTVAIKNDYADGNGDYAEYTVMEGRVNGVVYSDSNLLGLRGTNKGSKHVDDGGNLTYQGRVIAANIQAVKRSK